MNSNSIIVEQTFSVSVTEVWKAITDPELMCCWFFEPIAEFAAEVGFETQFDVESEGTIYPHQWKVTEVVPNRKIVYDWKYRGFPGNSFVTWDLTETSDGTKLTLTHTVTEPFPQDDPVFSSESCEAGWRFLIQENLKSFLSEQSS